MRRPSSNLVCLGMMIILGQSSAEANLVANPGFEKDMPHWTASGEATTARRVAVEPHSGAACLYVVDNGDTIGQANSPNFHVPSGLFYVEAWLRVDPQHHGRAHFDVQFFNNQKHVIGSGVVGETVSTNWVRIAGLVNVPEAADAVRLRVLPAFGDRKLRGACYVDEVYMVPFEEAEMAGRLSMKREVYACSNSDGTGKVGTVPPDIVGKPVPYESQVDFENLNGWQFELVGDVTGNFCRSREEQLAGNYVGKLTYSMEAAECAVIILRPPRPIPVGENNNAVEIWCHGDVRDAPGQAPRMVVVVRQADKLVPISLPAFAWTFWSIAHWRLPGHIGPNAEIVELRIDLRPSHHATNRTLYFDELAFHSEPTARMSLAVPTLLCSTQPEAIGPNFRDEVTNRIVTDGETFRLIGRTDNETVEYVYTPRTGTLDDLGVMVNGRLNFRPAAGGGPAAIDTDPNLQATLVNVGVQKDVLRAVWDYRTRNDSFEITWELQVHGKSLILTIDEPRSRLVGWNWGKPHDLAVEDVLVPYLTYQCESQPVRLMAKNAFVHMQPDWRVSHASGFSQDAAEYHPLTNGRRNPVHERIFVTVSTNFHEVLPNIPNPKSSTAHVLGENVYVNVAGSFDGDALDRCLALWRQMKSLGMERLIIKHHTDIWTSHPGQGDEPFVLSLTPAKNIPGGEKAIVEYLNNIKAMGMETFLYTDYCIVSPINRVYDESLCSLTPAGQWMIGWYSYYKLTPLMAPVFCQQLAPKLKERYGLTGSYCDQHTSIPLSGYVDFDPRKPGAGMAQTVFRAYSKTFEIERKAHGGPVVSEGGNHWFFAGLVDGNYAQLSHELAPQRWQVPFLVDFNLLKVHPLEVDLGVGWRTSYGYDQHAKGHDDALDRFQCASIAFGGSGVLYPPSFPSNANIHVANPLGEWKRSVARAYFMIQQLSSRYAMTPVKRIEYWDGQHRLSTSDAIRSGAYKNSQVHVEYVNGLRLWANGSFKDSWTVVLNDQSYELPPTGWLAMQGDEFVEYSAMRDGHRVDFVRSPVYTFADGRGTLTDFGGGLQAKDAIIILHNRGNEQHEIDIPMN